MRVDRENVCPLSEETEQKPEEECEPLNVVSQPVISSARDVVSNVIFFMGSGLSVLLYMHR
ncbi:hypothetical protein GCM10023116_24430 [Kistimonas scapharcae]|uniref:Uncharacterized protein n=1 Tax=Kistimonas scapharcae TaxID=1036133 RepID=A0ABP8V248_9GAMM